MNAGNAGNAFLAAAVVVEKEGIAGCNIPAAGRVVDVDVDDVVVLGLGKVAVVGLGKTAAAADTVADILDVVAVAAAAAYTARSRARAEEHYYTSRAENPPAAGIMNAAAGRFHERPYWVSWHHRGVGGPRRSSWHWDRKPGSTRAMDRRFWRNGGRWRRCRRRWRGW